MSVDSVNTGNTTDDQDELFDIVDADDRVIGQATRRECNSNPKLIHRSVFVLIRNDAGLYLWQKRSATKDTCPGAWVTATSGHVSAGDDYLETAVRETKEELGVDVVPRRLGKFLYRYARESEYSAIFLAESSGPFRPNPSEVEEVRFLAFRELLDLESKGELQLSKAVHYIAESLPDLLD